ncbi:MAG: energy-coupling factor transporter transmembrane protein EcfT [Propionibacterium sp.]|nr:energy-coupling factor transporter transmembrane protein EcfT [Propionibacterium sp.]
MNVHASLLGLYQPQDGWLFRLGAGWKYLLLLALTIPALVLWQWWFTLASLVLVLALLGSSGITVRRALNIGSMLWILLAILAVYQVVTLRFDQAVTSPGNVLLAVLASRMLTLTTSTPDLLDALAAGLRPLRWVRVDPDQVALAVAIMVRSIPFLLGSFAEVRDAARARGRDGNVLSLIVPAVVGAVAYAQSTGEALHARGVVERGSVDSADPPGRGSVRG